jgi:hypothetical protein
VQTACMNKGAEVWHGSKRVWMNTRVAATTEACQHRGKGCH